ncbi:MAG: hypothetical protein Q8K61_13055 [Gallionella sp.]|nr:hypothetical protein [Gallionella sp.]OGS67727.1 MAG: hypothetical protein A2Z87_06195 [Gallionellales bacterium GWA2_54_124]
MLKLLHGGLVLISIVLEIAEYRGEAHAANEVPRSSPDIYFLRSQLYAAYLLGFIKREGGLRPLF